MSDADPPGGASAGTDGSTTTDRNVGTDRSPATDRSAATEPSRTNDRGRSPDGRVATAYALQRDFRDRWALALVATTFGLALSTVHWIGLLVGGALVGLCWPTLRGALLAGLGFGVAVLLLVGIRFVTAGSLDEYLAMGQLLALSVAVPLVAGPLGASVRGLFPDAPAAQDGPGGFDRPRATDESPADKQ